ncbi:MAG: hypothetical protein K0R73_617 [Candidatus Midichloriaceae bacterium]|jgi:predicted Zn finger-like uncharacterized protein|nr:hypothetical protein [Candidatus Midichloriaceae bacterium]
MILSCNNCGAKFKVPDSAIGINGRKVKCSACEYEWFQEGIKPQEEFYPQESVSPQEEVHFQESANFQEDFSQEHVKQDTQPTPRVMKEEPEQKKEEIKPTIRIPIKPQEQKLYEKTWLMITFKVISMIALVVLAFILAVTYKKEIIKKFPNAVLFFDAIHLQDVSNLRFDFVDCTLNSENAENDASGQVELNVKVIAKNIGKSPQLLDAVRFSVYTKEKDFIGDYTMNLNKIIEPGKEEVIEGRLNHIPKEVMFVVIEMGNYFNLAVARQSAILGYKAESSEK